MRILAYSLILTRPPRQIMRLIVPPPAPWGAAFYPSADPWGNMRPHATPSTTAPSTVHQWRDLSDPVRFGGGGLLHRDCGPRARLHGGTDPALGVAVVPETTGPRPTPGGLGGPPVGRSNRGRGGGPPLHFRPLGSPPPLGDPPRVDVAPWASVGGAILSLCSHCSSSVCGSFRDRRRRSPEVVA